MIEALYNRKCLLEYIKPNVSAEDPKEHKSKEDTKTSSILGLLSLLPDELLLTILFESLSDFSCKNNPGRLMDVEFWPHWKYHGTEAGDNKQFVEPDVVLKFSDNEVIIIEAKNDIENLQDEKQWEREIRAACNEGYEVVSLIALDGNKDYEPVTIHGVSVFKTSWSLLLDAVVNRTEALENVEPDYSGPYKLDSSAREPITRGWIRILKQVQKAFALFGYFPTRYMESLPGHAISQDSTEYFRKFR